ncbi:hypothetical protein [Sphingobium ummariense]|uniref:Uncharacterized protein n=1 Tax=Sphingobium ummariense RL-3 TaxID=1346791 RepID=T0J352_9SPHN|nr:hypothetical protein [Sphingobium ummariense]EQB31252.1 hypothetical protein M529_16055 [Sphingobium ummariense RL-3]
MPIDDAVGEAVGFIVRQAGGLVVDLTVEHVFSRHTARFFHGVGRRVIAAATLGRKRIPSSLRTIPVGTHPRPRPADWWALWVGIGSWIALFLILGLAVTPFL